MPSDLSSYLATNYLIPDTKPSSKKRKRKHDKSSGGGLLIQDDDDQGWGSSSKSRHGRSDGEDDHNAPVTVGKVKDVRKTTKANWKTLGASSSSGGPTSKEDRDAAAAADAILASAAAETAAARAAEDDAPTIVDDQTPAAARMADGTHAGLQSAAAVTAQIERRQQEERDQFEAERRAGLVKHGEEETYYRDATGRRVDVSMKRAEARRAAQEAENKERAAKDALKGDVQADEARRRREQLEDARTMTFARTADDEDINRAMREERRWNDPMARFLGEADGGGGGGAVASGATRGGAAGKSGGVSSRRPVYKGPSPPNRYGIKPGYRWDGVDRSNGFEADRFKAINRRERNKGLEYSWQMDE